MKKMIFFISYCNRSHLMCDCTSNIIQTGFHLGTPAYVSPEVARTQPAEQLRGKRLPADVKAILCKALAKMPQDRQQNTSELVTELEQCESFGAWQPAAVSAKQALLNTRNQSKKICSSPNFSRPFMRKVTLVSKNKNRTQMRGAHTILTN